MGAFVKYSTIFMVFENDEHGEPVYEESPSGQTRRVKRLAEPDEISCLVHKTIAVESMEQLASFGAFSYQSVLKATNTTAMEDSVRWDYVKRYIEEWLDVDLFGLNNMFFKHHGCTGYDPDIYMPERYLAGRGRVKTVGLANLCRETNGKLSTAKLEFEAEKLGGKADSLMEKAKKAELVDAIPKGSNEHLEDASRNAGRFQKAIASK